MSRDRDLAAVEYDPVEKTEKRLAMAETQAAATLGAYYKKGQEFRYLKGI